MKKMETILWRTLYTLLFLSAGWISHTAYSQVETIRADRTVERTDWVSRTQTRRLMRYHGTDALKITKDKVYIWRGSKWIPVLKRGQG